MVQSSCLLYEILNGATIFEKQILFLAASSFGIPDPLFGLYYVYIYHQVFYLSNFRIKVLWIAVIMDGFSRDQWNNIDGMVYFILFDGTEQSC